MRTVFKLEKVSWKRSIVRRGMNLLMQASLHLTAAPTTARID